MKNYRKEYREYRDPIMLRKLYEEGLTLAQIANRYGVCFQLISRFMKKFNISTRKYDPIGKSNPHWKGGIHIDKGGYIYRKRREHPFSNHLGYVFEHRLIMEKHLDRYMLPSEFIHHKNGNRADNRIENLEILTKAEHNRLHQGSRGQFVKHQKGKIILSISC